MQDVLGATDCAARPLSSAPFPPGASRAALGSGDANVTGQTDTRSSVPSTTFRSLSLRTREKEVGVCDVRAKPAPIMELRVACKDQSLDNVCARACKSGDSPHPRVSTRRPPPREKSNGRRAQVDTTVTPKHVTSRCTRV